MQAESKSNPMKSKSQLCKQTKHMKKKSNEIRESTIYLLLFFISFLFFVWFIGNICFMIRQNVAKIVY